MSVMFTKKTTDRSDCRSFSFSFYCDRCGREYRSRTIPFEQGGLSDIENDEAKRLLWADEHRSAFAEAKLEAQSYLSYCRHCGRWVCDDCFYLSESEDTDVCKDCKNERSETMKKERTEEISPERTEMNRLFWGSIILIIGISIGTIAVGLFS